MSACDMGHPTSFIHRVWPLLCHAEGLITAIHFVTWDGIGNICIAILQMYDTVL